MLTAECDYEMDIQVKQEEARQEGRLEGRQEGRLEERTQMIMKALTATGSVLSIQSIKFKHFSCILL